MNTPTLRSMSAFYPRDFTQSCVFFHRRKLLDSVCVQCNSRDVEFARNTTIKRFTLRMLRYNLAIEKLYFVMYVISCYTCHSKIYYVYLNSYFISSLIVKIAVSLEFYTNVYSGLIHSFQQKSVDITMIHKLSFFAISEITLQ